jgi:hypothetical protein
VGKLTLRVGNYAAFHRPAGAGFPVLLGFCGEPQPEPRTAHAGLREMFDVPYRQYYHRADLHRVVVGWHGFPSRTRIDVSYGFTSGEQVQTGKDRYD